ncbi:UNVERIFIED_CONTAM: hypothetical protein GTU68_008687 [Idotea baltica]|nr:hypothetical protein [Idotea baltica]
MNTANDNTFPREARLLDGTSYGTVFKKNKRLTNRYWIVLGHRSQSPTSRLGLAIAKKRAKRAVDRNLIKRIARESFRYNRLVLKGFDVVVMNKDAAAKATSIELRQSLDTLWVDLASRK